MSGSFVFTVNCHSFDNKRKDSCIVFCFKKLGPALQTPGGLLGPPSAATILSELLMNEWFPADLSPTPSPSPPSPHSSAYATPACLCLPHLPSSSCCAVLHRDSPSFHGTVCRQVSMESSLVAFNTGLGASILLRATAFWAVSGPGPPASSHPSPILFL